ncbi:MAG: hypothetical protein HZB71_14755 [Betaproteobacteria bacterium]|nr:hypothetical protein [Betaproteobacteria bacterium]
MSASAKIVWDTDLKLFSPLMLGRWTWAMVVTLGVMLLIMGAALVPNEGWRALAGIAPMFAAVTGGLWLLGLIIMAVVFRGRYAVRYTVSSAGIRLETMSAAAKTSNRLAIVVGALARKPGVAGAGLIAASQETQEVKWGGRFHAAYNPDTRMIEIKGPWRTLLLVQCTPENYAEVAARVEAELKRHRTAARIPAKSPLPGYLLRTVVTVIACVPMFALADEYRLDIFMPIFILCFALATVWLLPVLAWAVLGGMALFAIEFIVAMLEERTSLFDPGETYLRYTVLSGDDWAMLAVVGAGMAWLGWLCVSALRGRVGSALAADQGDMEGGGS